MGGKDKLWVVVKLIWAQIGVVIITGLGSTKKSAKSSWREHEKYSYNSRLCKVYKTLLPCSRTNLNLNVQFPLTPELPASTIFGRFEMGAGGRPGPLFTPHDDPDDTGGDDLADVVGFASFCSSPVRPFTQSSSATAKKLFRSCWKKII